MNRVAVRLFLMILVLALAAPVGAATKSAKKKRAVPAPVASDEDEQVAPARPRPSGDPGTLRIRVPGKAKVRAVSLALEGEEHSVVEDQSAEEPDSIVNIGWSRDTTVGFKDDDIESKGRKLRDRSAVFYVFSGVESLLEFELTPAFFKRGLSLEDTGRTPPIFRFEVLELDRIGDVEGSVLKRFDGVSFTIGESNRFRVGVEVPTGKKVGLRVSVPGDLVGRDEVLLQVKASRKGKFPVRLVSGPDSSADPEKIRYQPRAKFVFVPRAGDIDTFSNPTESLAAQINRYLERHGGSESEVEVPLKVKVELR